ncbi:MAG TPA: ABC transporter permease [Stellaceae bacterium]|nr:ABC transporter permease [Stellaceae bacterium]
MPIELERRSEPSRAMMLASPAIAVVLTIAAAAALLAAVGVNPLRGLAVYFIEPLGTSWSLQELAVKASPLVMIAVGLAVCFRANTWNIGAEGQYLAGAMLGGWFALAYHATGAWWVLPGMLLLGALGGVLYALLPAVLRVLFGASEILTSLMLVYVAQFALDYLVRGPWRDPHGFNFPQTVTFEPAATMPLLLSGGRLHVGVLLALLAVAVAVVFLGTTLRGFELRVVGMAPRAGRFAGFDDRRDILLAFAVSGALAGLAGIIEVAGPIGQLLPNLSPGYGFAAIIVAFLGRLNPLGILVAGFVLALSYLGGEQAQIALRVPLDLTIVLQGVLLFCVLACDTLILYRVRLLRLRHRTVPGVP